MIENVLPHERFLSHHTSPRMAFRRRTRPAVPTECHRVPSVGLPPLNLPPSKLAASKSERHALHAMILAVQNVHASLAVHDEGPRIVQLPRPAAWAAPRAERFSRTREFLHTLIAILHNVQRRLVAGAEGDVVRIGKLPRRAAGAAPRSHKLAVGREYLNAMVTSIGDVEMPVRPERHGADARELARR